MNKSLSIAGKRYIADFSVIIAFYTVVRLIVYSKMSFMWKTINNYMQYLDPVILRHNLLVGLRDLHVQPPLFNVFLGVILKLFPEYPPVFSVLYFVMGLAISCLSYLICMHLTKRRLVSIAAACIIASFPPLLQADRWLFYAYPLTLLLLCACFFIIHSQKNTGAQISFIVVCAAIVLSRSFFHLIIWLVPMILLVVFLSMRFKRRALVIVVAVGLLAWILSSVPYFRNYARYGMFTGSTFQGQNFAMMTAYVGENEITNMISQGRITPLARIKKSSGPEIYFAYFKKVPKNNSTALDAPYKFNRGINWNNEIYAIASKEYQQNSLELIKAYPLKYLKAVLNEFYIFLGDEPYHFLWNQDEWLNFRRDSVVNFISDAGRLAGIPLLIFGMYAAALAGFILRISKSISSNTISEAIIRRRCEIFIVFNLAYVLLTASMFELGEGCFYRIPIDPFLIIGAAVFITDYVPGFFEIYRWSGKSQEVCGQKSAFIRRTMTGGTVLFFAGLCVWNIYVVFNGSMLPGMTYSKNYNEELKTYGEMIKDCKQVIRINSGDAEVYDKLGAAYSQLCHYNEAIRALKRAICIKPNLNNAIEYCCLGIIYNKTGCWKKAVKAFKQAIHIDPSMAIAYHGLGMTYVELGYYREAIDALKRAIQIKPDYSEAHYGLGTVYLITGDTASALNEYKILKDLKGNVADKLFNPSQK